MFSVLRMFVAVRYRLVAPKSSKTVSAKVVEGVALPLSISLAVNVIFGVAFSSMYMFVYPGIFYTKKNTP